MLKRERESVINKSAHQSIGNLKREKKMKIHAHLKRHIKTQHLLFVVWNAQDAVLGRFRRPDFMERRCRFVVVVVIIISAHFWGKKMTNYRYKLGAYARGYQNAIEKGFFFFFFFERRRRRSSSSGVFFSRRRFASERRRPFRCFRERFAPQKQPSTHLLLQHFFFFFSSLSSSSHDDASVLGTDRSVALFENEERGHVFRREEFEKSQRSSHAVRLERRFREF